MIRPSATLHVPLDTARQNCRSEREEPAEPSLREHSTAGQRVLHPVADVVLARVAQACAPDKPLAMQHYVFHWAVDRAKQRYPDPRWHGAAIRS